MNKSGIVALGFALLLLVVSCGDSGKPEEPGTTPTPAAGTPEAGGDAAAPNPAVPETPAEITKGELPKFYPSDLPTYPDAKPANSIMIGGAGLVMLSVTAPADAVLAHYREALPAQGWTIDQVTEEPARIAAHKDGRKATISISSRGDETEIGVALSGS